MQVDISGYGVVDVTAGRELLKKKLEDGDKIKVVIEAEVIDIHSYDDGVSREFELSISSFKIVES